MAVFDHFDFLAPIYETFIPGRGSEALLAQLRLPAAGPVLDAGGGTGRVAQYLRGKAEPVIVADLSRQMLAQAKLKDGLTLVCAHTEVLPFASHSIPRIILVDALHHVIDQRHTLEELWRILAPGGRLVIEEPDLRTFGVKLLALAEKAALMRSHFLTPPQIADLLRFPDARVLIETSGFNAWVVADKAG